MSNKATMPPSITIDDKEFEQLAHIPERTTWQQVPTSKDKLVAWYKQDTDGPVTVQIEVVLPFAHDDVFAMFKHVHMRSNSERCETAKIVQQLSEYVHT